MTPTFTNVQYHKAYTIRRHDGECSTYEPSMTALDEYGYVWRNWQRQNGSWNGWTRITDLAGDS